MSMQSAADPIKNIEVTCNTSACWFGGALKIPQLVMKLFAFYGKTRFMTLITTASTGSPPVPEISGQLTLIQLL